LMSKTASDAATTTNSKWISYEFLFCASNFKGLGEFLIDQSDSISKGDENALFSRCFDVKPTILKQIYFKKNPLKTSFFGSLSR
jgi:hypothetical protein